jgi:hypothetical protein
MKFEFYTLQEKFPKAIKKLLQWDKNIWFVLGANCGQGEIIYEIKNVRGLYDFFDEQGIYGGIDPQRYDRFYWLIRHYKDRLHYDTYNCYEQSEILPKSRQEAEYSMCLKQFEILNEQLKTK